MTDEAKPTAVEVATAPARSRRARPSGGDAGRSRLAVAYVLAACSLAGAALLLASWLGRHTGPAWLMLLRYAAAHWVALFAVGLALVSAGVFISSLVARRRPSALRLVLILLALPGSCASGCPHLLVVDGRTFTGAGQRWVVGATAEPLERPRYTLYRCDHIFAYCDPVWTGGADPSPEITETSLRIPATYHQSPYRYER